MKLSHFGNRLCQQREIEKRQLQHKKKIRSMRPTSKSNARRLMDTTEPRSALHLKMNLKKQQLQGEHFSQIERENQLLMNKIYHIMNDEIGEKATEYLPGVRITKNQMPTVDCHINEKTRTIIAGKAILSKSLNFEAWERKYNKICEENKNMQDRLRDRKSTYDRKEWKKFSQQQKLYSANARARDVTAGHLPKPNPTALARNRGLSRRKAREDGIVGIKNEIIRQRSSPTPKKQHRKKMQQSKSMMVEADSQLEDGSRCLLEISELSTSFHNQYELLTHGSSGLLVFAKVTSDDGEDGSTADRDNSVAHISGEAIIGLDELKKIAAREGLEEKLPVFMSLLPFEERPDLFPTFESAVPNEEENIISQMLLGNLFIKRFGTKLKVTLGRLS